MSAEKAADIDSESLSSYASVDSVVLIEKKATPSTGSAAKASSLDFSGLLKPRTVISFSAKNNALVQLGSGDEPDDPNPDQIMYELHQACFLNDVNKVKWLIGKYKKAKSNESVADLLSVKVNCFSHIWNRIFIEFLRTNCYWEHINRRYIFN